MVDYKPFDFLMFSDDVTESKIEELVDAVNDTESFKARRDESVGTLDIFLIDDNDTKEVDEEVGC